MVNELKQEISQIKRQISSNNGSKGRFEEEEKSSKQMIIEEYD